MNACTYAYIQKKVLNYSKTETGFAKGDKTFSSLTIWQKCHFSNKSYGRYKQENDYLIFGYMTSS